MYRTVKFSVSYVLCCRLSYHSFLSPIFLRHSAAWLQYCWDGRKPQIRQNRCSPQRWTVKAQMSLCNLAVLCSQWQFWTSGHFRQYCLFVLCWSFTAQSTTRSRRTCQLIVALFLGRLRPSKRLTSTKRGRPHVRFYWIAAIARLKYHNRAGARQNYKKQPSAKQRFWSACISVQSDQSLCWSPEEALSP